MKLVKTEDVSAVAKRLTVEIEAEKVTKALDSAYKKVGRQARIKGFRPGKVPRAVLERYYGPDVGQEVAQQLIGEAAPESIEASGLTPITQPAVESLGTMLSDQPLEFTMLVEIAPEIEIDGYFGLEVERPEREVTDEMVQGKLDDLRSMHSTLEPVEEGAAASEGDTVLADIKAMEDGQVLADGELSGYSISLGQSRFNEAAEKALLGAKSGDVVKVKAAFPANFYYDTFAGKELDLEMTVQDIKKTVLPELDDEFAKSLGEKFQTVDDLKDEIKKGMTEAAERDSERAVNDAILDQLLEKVEFEVPEGLIDLELRNMFEQVERSLMMRGMNMQAAGIDPAKLEEDLRPQALRRCQEDLILNAISEKESFEISEEELDEGFAELAETTGQSVAEVEKFHAERDMTETFKASLLKRKTLKRLIAEAKITVVEAPAEDEEAEAAAE